MKISYNWLKNFLPFDVKHQDISVILTNVGLEVEDVYVYRQYNNDMAHCVIGEVVTCEKHPNADKLKCTTVNVGGEKLLNIVCGAPNVDIGQKVIVAQVGAVLNTFAGQKIEIKKAKIRQIESEGMICAEDELGISDNHDGIMILPNNVIIGQEAKTYFNLYEDYIYEIGLTPNRGDAMSHYGVARDIIAYYNYHQNKNYVIGIPQHSVNTIIKKEIKNDDISIVNQLPDACKRFSGVLIKNVTIKPSPKYLIDKLNAIGVKAINNIVDITNYILHHYGQPLHAYDYDKIKDKQIFIEHLAENTSFIGLDGKEKKLSSKDIMICDGGHQGLCMAGVFGSNNSGVTEHTKNIFLEAAHFDATLIRQTSFKHQLRTEAALHFEKNIDISNISNILMEAAKLIADISNASISNNVIDIISYPLHNKIITCSHHYITTLSGKNYTTESIKKILTSLQFKVEQKDNQNYIITVPHYKTDVDNANDIVEEIMRIDGFNNIPEPSHIKIPVNNTSADNSLFNFRERVAENLCAIGIQELCTNSITNRKYAEALQYDESNFVPLLNTLSSELDILKPTMLFNGLEVIAHNIARQQKDIKCFEIGKKYSKKNNEFKEIEKICFWISGNNHNKQWQKNEEENNIYTMKSIVEYLVSTTGKQIIFKPQTQNNNVCQSIIDVYIDKIFLGYIGKLNLNALKLFNIKQSVFFAEIDFITLYQLSTQKIIYKEVSKYPTVYRDLAIVLDKKTSYQEIQDNILKLSIPQLKHIHVFDVFESEKIGKDKKSIAFNLTLVNEQKTMTDEEVDSIMKKIITCLEKNLNANVRA